jgi:protein-tyrosine-phosphatase
MTDESRTIAFVCLHGSAKSLIAAAHLNRIAHERGLALRADSLGVEPDVGVPALVVDGLAGDGIDVRGYIPKPVTRQALAAATHVVSLSCELPAFVSAGTPIEEWTDLPMVSDGFDLARDEIVARVERLIDVLK